ncbi:MAG: nucleotide sugar dehydrogenase [Chitinophagales bacterium]
MINIAVFGLGFVGLPLSLSFAINKCNVWGVDIDKHLIDELNNGITHHLEVYKEKTVQDILNEELASGRFQAYSDGLAVMSQCTVIIITVGIPVQGNHINLEHLTDACRLIGHGLKPNDLVLVRSTVVPGMTRKVILPILEKTSGLKAGADFYLAYCSERIAEGKAFDEFENMPVILAGIDRESTEQAVKLLSVITRAPITCAKQMEEVETAKLLENISRDVNIAMANEFARFCNSINVNIFEVIKAANTHTRVNILTPGPGVGGYCLPNALPYLEALAREQGLDLPLLQTARQVNEDMPGYVSDLVLRHLPVSPAKAKVAVLGLAMKDYSNDDRLSPAFKVIKTLQDAGCEVKVFDSAVTTQYPFKVDNLEEAIAGAHALLILALQKDIDYQDLNYFRKFMYQEAAPLIVDIKNLYHEQQVLSQGFQLQKL